MNKKFLDYMQRDFRENSGSLCTLDRRLRYYSINKTGKNVSVQEFQQVILEEITGPWCLLG